MGEEKNKKKNEDGVSENRKKTLTIFNFFFFHNLPGLCQWCSLESSNEHQKKVYFHLGSSSELPGDNYLSKRKIEMRKWRKKTEEVVREWVAYFLLSLTVIQRKRDKTNIDKINCNIILEFYIKYQAYTYIETFY